MPVVTVAGVLGVLDSSRLSQLAREFSIALPQDAPKPKQVANIANASPGLEKLLPRLTRDELRAACRAHMLDHRGRSRDELMTRLGVAPDAPKPEPDRVLHHTVGLPYPGDIAVVRHRQYMVEDVIQPPIYGQQTRVKLVCLDDDDAGRELEVFWERELGARVIKPEDKGLGTITKLDAPRHFAAYLTRSSGTASRPRTASCSSRRSAPASN